MQPMQKNNAGIKISYDKIFASKLIKLINLPLPHNLCTVSAGSSQISGLSLKISKGS